MQTQWNYFLQNLGEWHGSFTRFSSKGQEVSDTPTLVTLEGSNGNQNVHQVVRYLPSNEPSREVVVDYDSLNRSILFFANGAFSQGSMQWDSHSTFGGEFGLIDNEFGDGSRRLRMVQLYNSSSQLDRVVLIREKLPNSNIVDRPHLKVADLLGEWQGIATTMYADLRNPDSLTSHLQIIQKDSEHIEQHLSFGNQTISSIAKIKTNKLLFANSNLPTQVLLLPDGASCTCPLEIELGNNFILEMGWLIQSNIRQRILRSYNEQGNWVSCSFVTERKII